MKNKVVIIGASGMIGTVVLKECLSSNNVEEIISLVRRPGSVQHTKLKEIVLDDFLYYSSVQTELENVDAAYCCVGVYTGAVPKDIFRKITTDIPNAFADAVFATSPQARFCFLSGAGAKRDGKGAMFAVDKGAAENHIAALGFKSFHTFRPGYIYPVEKRQEPNLMYRVSRRLYPVLKFMGNKYSITSVQLGKSMFQVGMEGASLEELENQDIIAVLE